MNGNVGRGDRGVLASRLAAIAFAAAVATAIPVAAQPAAQPAPRASAVVAYRDLDRIATVEGTVEAVRQSTLAAQVAGRVVALPVKAGDAVKAGQVLVQIDARSAVQAETASQSQVREAQANLVNAKAKYQRSQQLHAQNFISRAALDQAENDFRAAEAQAAAASANAAVAATARSYTTLTAPYDGVVASTDVDVGDMATAGRPLVTVFDPRELRVTATLPQAVLAKAMLDLPIRVEIASQPRPLVAQHATVIPVADTRTHTTRVRLGLPATPGLMPGQYARAAIVVGRTRVLAIPTDAVLRRSEVTAVYVLGVEGRLQLRQVRLGESAGDGLVEVLAGLAAGERVALDPVKAGIEASRSADPSPRAERTPEESGTKHVAPRRADVLSATA